MHKAYQRPIKKFGTQTCEIVNQTRDKNAFWNSNGAWMTHKQFKLEH